MIITLVRGTQYILKRTSNNSQFVTPAQAGVQLCREVMDSCFRRNDIFRGSLKRMDWIRSVGGDANGVEGYGQVDTGKAIAFHGEAVDQELFYPIQTIDGNGGERQRSRGLPLSRSSRSLLYIQSPHFE